ncbi:MAG: EamA family transporter [Pseudomonadota bacterium]
MTSLTERGRLAGVAAVIGAAVLWGSTGTLQALMPEGRDPLVVAEMRLAIGALALLALALADPAARRAVAAPVSRSALPMRGAAAAGGAIALYNILFFLAVIEAGVGVGTAIAIGSAPIWVAAWELAVHRRLPGGWRAFGTALSIAGASILVLAGTGEGASLGGMLLAALAGAAYASYSLLTSAIGGRAPPVVIAASTFTVAALAGLPVLAVAETGWLADPRAWGPLLALGIGATGLAYALYTWGLARVAPATAVTLALAEPLTAWVLASVVVGESVTLAKIAGALCLVAGLAVVSRAPAREGG